ncbi:MAG: Gfo/Idh/MocA family oxidoreductase [Candidatus Hydrogenedentes bacterium]|nr:Gfo/Idh/MocA family oxidoreductase [Candidatus Hydrogenedentota bacterium]
MDRHELTRRAFLAAATTTATLAAGSAIAQAPNTAKVVPRKLSPNEKVNVAAIGAGGKGLSDIMSVAKLGENVVALCDVDWDRCAEAFYRLPDAKRFKDYRNMLEQMPEIDAVTVSTPDHTHAPAAYMAMKMGKHVYAQKPLTHTVAEARLLTVTAKETGVMTQMGNQGHCGNGVRTLCEMIWSGAIGPVREVHIWTHRPVWDNQGMTEPLPPMVTPENLDWDRWIGCAPWRPYNKKLAPHDWRAWQDFGSGCLGDMACHIMDPAYWALKLYEASDFTVEVVEQRGRNDQTFPITTTIKYAFPARGDMPPVDVYWYDGHWPDPATGEKVYNRPRRPEGIPADEVLGDKDLNGSLFIGDKGMLTAGEYGGEPRLVPSALMKDYTMPPETLERIPDENPYFDWIRGIKEGKLPCSNFSYSGPFTEMVQFGNLAVKSGQKLHWDNINGVVTNVPNPKEIVSKEYRKGWELPC